jgi:hypothetical protein
MKIHIDPIKVHTAESLVNASSGAELVVSATDYSTLMDAYRELQRSNDKTERVAKQSEAILANAMAIIDGPDSKNSDTFWSHPHPLLIQVCRLVKGLRPHHADVAYEKELEVLHSIATFEVQNFSGQHSPIQLKQAINRAATVIELMPTDVRVITPAMASLKSLTDDLRDFVEEADIYTTHVELKQVLESNTSCAHFQY